LEKEEIVERNLDTTFAALADPTRRRVVGLLREKPFAPSELADSLSTTRPAMSRHLRILRAAGLVDEESPHDDARVKLYHLRRAQLAEVREWLDEIEAFWTAPPASVKAQADRKPRKRPR
jgi:DNA-binding transcriptional ArsR family regulator